MGIRPDNNELQTLNYIGFVVLVALIYITFFI